MGATNHPARIDPALLRSGRLDRTIHIAPPDAKAIAAILARYSGADASERNFALLANRPVGQTGVDIEGLVRQAKASARRASWPAEPQRIVLGAASTFGSSVQYSDLSVATTIATDLEFKTGFGECGVIYLSADGRTMSSTSVASIRRRIEAALARASAILIENAGELERVDLKMSVAAPVAPGEGLLH